MANQKLFDQSLVPVDITKRIAAATPTQVGADNFTIETLMRAIGNSNYNFDIYTGGSDSQLLPAGTAIVGVNFYDETGTIEDPINIRIGTTLNGEQILADVPITPGDANGQRISLCYSNAEAVTVYIGISYESKGVPVKVCLETKKIY